MSRELEIKDNQHVGFLYPNDEDNEEGYEVVPAKVLKVNQEQGVVLIETERFRTEAELHELQPVLPGLDRYVGEIYEARLKKLKGEN